MYGVSFENNSTIEDLIEKMQYKMCERDNKIYQTEFKRFFLELLYFYWNLSDDNEIVLKLEKSFGMSLAQYSAHVAKSTITIELIQKIIDILRKDLNFVIKSKALVNNTKTLFEVEFEIYLIK